MSNFQDSHDRMIKQGKSIYKKAAQRKSVAPAPETPIPDTYGTPVRALQDHGVHLPIKDVNAKVAAITDAHERAYGRPPTAGLVFDLLRADPQLQKAGAKLEHLFRAPTLTREWKTRIAARDAAIGVYSAFQPTEGAYLPGLMDEKGNLTTKNPGTNLVWVPPKFAPLLPDGTKNPRVFNAKGEMWPAWKEIYWHNIKSHSDVLQNQSMGLPDALLIKANPLYWGIKAQSDLTERVLSELGMDVDLDAERILGATWRTADLARTQIIQGIESLPYGLFEMVSTAYHDNNHLMSALDRGELPSRSGFHTDDLMLDMAKQVYQDFRHIEDNPGFATMDAFGFLTLGWGIRARMGAAAAAGKGSKIRTFVKKPYHGSYELGYSALKEQQTLFDNSFAAALQKRYLKARQNNLNRSQTSPSQKRQHHLWDVFLSEEKKLSRMTMNRHAFEYGMSQAPVREMQRFTRWQATAREVWDRVLEDPKLASQIPYETTKTVMGWERALTFLFSDDVDPVKTWRAMHDRKIKERESQLAEMREWGAKDLDMTEAEFLNATSAMDNSLKSHRDQQKINDLGEAVLKEMPKRFRPFYEAALKVEAHFTAEEKAVFDLTDRVANQHKAEVGAWIRGDEVSFDPEIGKYIVDPEMFKYAKVRDITDKAHAAVEKARSKLATAEKKLIEPTKKGNTAGDRPKRKAAVEARKAEVKQAELAFALAEKQFNAIPEPKMIPLQRQITGNEKYIDVYHGTTKSFDRLQSGDRWGTASWGKGIYFTTNPQRASSYTTYFAREHAGETPNVKMHKVDEGKLFDLTSKDPTYLASVVQSVRAVLSKELGDEFAQLVNDLPAQRRANAKLAPLTPGGKSDEHSGMIVHDALGMVHNMHDLDGKAMTSDVLSKAGFHGVKFGDEVVIFDSKHLLDRFPDQATQNLRELRDSHGSAYQPFRRALNVMTDNVRGTFKVKSKHGAKPPDLPAAMRFRWNGTSFEFGDYYWDTSHMLADTSAQVFKAAAVYTHFQDLWKASKEKPTSPYDMVIRDISTAPDIVKRVAFALAQRKLTEKSADDLGEEQLAEFWKHLAPTEAELNLMTPEEKKHLRFIDERFILDNVSNSKIGYYRQLEQDMQKWLGPINEPWRVMLLYASLGYALNGLGSAALLLTKTGPMAFPSFNRAIFSGKIWNGEVARMFDFLAGDTLTNSFLDEASKWTMGSRALASGWQKVTDSMFRRAAVIYELRRRKLINDKMTPEEVLFSLNKPENKVKVKESSDAARSAMLNFNEMTWPERAYFRHTFFIYSFMRAGAKYGIHYLIEHPLQYMALTSAAGDREQDLEQLLGGKVPEWFYRAGFVPYSDDGGPRAWNPAQINLPGVLAAVSHPVDALFGDVPYASIEDFMGGAPTFAKQVVTGKDSAGKDLPLSDVPGGGGRILGSFLALARESPLGSMFKRIEKEEQRQELPRLSARAKEQDPISSAMNREIAAADNPSFIADKWMDQYGRFLFRTGVPVKPDGEALDAKYWMNVKERDPEAYRAHELDNLKEKIALQQVATGKNMPPEARDAVNMIVRYTRFLEDFQDKQPPRTKLSDSTLLIETVRFLIKDGKVKPGKMAQVKAENAKNDGDKLWARRERWSLIWNNGGKPWQRWVEEANMVDWYADQGYARVVNTMNQKGLGDYSASMKASDETKWKYGQQTVAYLDRLEEMEAAADAVEGSFAKKKAYEKIRQFENANSGTVDIDGVFFPPLSAASGDDSYTRSPEDSRKTKERALMQRDPSEMNTFEKNLLGITTDEEAEDGWDRLYDHLATVEDAKDPGESISAKERRYYEDQYAAQLPGFKKELDLARSSTAERMLSYRPIKESRYAEEWEEVLSYAAEFAQKAKAGGHPAASMMGEWKLKGVPVLKEIIDEKGVGFKREIRAYATKVVNGKVVPNPSFYAGLVKGRS